MKRASTYFSVVTLAAVVLLVGACESTRYQPILAKPFVVHRSPHQMIPSRWDAPAKTSDNELKVPVAAPQPRALPKVSAADGSEVPANSAEAVDAIIAAKQAEAGNDDSAFQLNAVERYLYEDGAVYPVVTSPGFVTVVELEPGESVLNVAGGDTANWLVDTIDGGQDQQVRANVLIKPRRPFLQTNFVITTDRRTYHLAASSLDSTTYHSAVNWNYAQDKMVVRRTSTDDVSKAVVNTQDEATTPNVNYGYFLLTRQHTLLPVWTPLRVYDDGRQVTIEFPKESRNFARPVLFSRAANGQLHLINHRTEQDRCVTQSLFQEAELRLGSSVVRITRANYRFYAQPPQR